LIDWLLRSWLTWQDIARWRSGLLLLLLLLWLLWLLLRSGLLVCGFVHGARCDVKTFVNLLRDWLNLGTELLLDPVQVKTVLVGYKVDGEAEVSETSRSANSMEVCLRVLGKIKIDDDVDGLDIDTAGKEI
jgi:hypothetical protein